jgi:hypothetical protein
MSESWLAVVGGGLAAAVLTTIFNVCWDYKKQKLTEDWEFRRYHANMIHIATVGIVEAFFSAKIEFTFMVATLGSLLATLNQLTAQADAIVRHQGGPQMTVAELEQKKAQLLQPFQTFNQEQVNLKWNQYDQKARERQSRVEAHLNTLEPLISAHLHAEAVAFYVRLSQPFPWTLQGAQEKLRLLEDNLPELNRIRGLLAQQIEIKLGRLKG